MNHSLPPKVTVAAAEDLLDIATRQKFGAGPFRIDCSACTHISLGAGYRLGNLLRAIADAGPLTVILPEGTYSGVSAPQEFFLAFTRSGLGPAINRYASSIRTRSADITESINEYYRKTLSTQSANATYIFDVHLGAIDVEDEARFGRHVSNLLIRANIGVAALDRASLSDAIALCFEGSQNVVDHANKKPFNGGSILSYLSIRYYKSAFSADDGAFTGYLKRAKSALSNSSKVNWLELVINDDGNGIAARQTLDPEVYRASLSIEQKAFQEALAKSSVKLRAGDSKVRGGVTGEGFSRIRRSLRQLRAFASVRSGRCYATFDGLSPIQDLFSLNSGKFGLALGSMPGTSLQVVIPLINSNMQQDLLPLDH